MQRSEFTNINKKIGNKVKRDGNFCSVVRFFGYPSILCLNRGGSVGALSYRLF